MTRFEKIGPQIQVLIKNDEITLCDLSVINELASDEFIVEMPIWILLDWCKTNSIKYSAIIPLIEKLP